MTAAGIGALTGAFGTASLGQIQRRGWCMRARASSWAGSCSCSVSSVRCCRRSILAFCVAVASQLFITMASALYHTYTPDELRGRVMGLSTVVVQGGLSTGAMLLGALGAAVGIGAAMAAGGSLYALFAAGALARVGLLRQQPTAATSS